MKKIPLNGKRYMWDVDSRSLKEILPKEPLVVMLADMREDDQLFKRIHDFIRESIVHGGKTLKQAIDTPVDQISGIPFRIHADFPENAVMLASKTEAVGFINGEVVGPVKIGEENGSQ